MIGLTTVFEQDIWYKASPVALLFFVGKTIRKGFEQFKSLVLPNSFVLAWFLSQRNWLLIGILVGIWVILIFAVAFVRYWRFRFKLTPNSISVREGVLKERQLDLEFERIRAVNYKRGLVDRVLGLTGISFDTAGSGEAEATIPAVSMKFAESLRASIEEKRTELLEPELSQDWAFGEKENLLIPTFEWPEMLRIGFSSGNFLFVATFIGAISAFSGQYSSAFTESDSANQTNLLARAVMWIVTHGHELHAGVIPGIHRTFSIALIFVELVLLLVVLTMIFNLVSAIFQWYRFSLFRENDTLKSVAGLTTVRETRLTLPKIQSVVISENLRSHWFSFFKLTARQSHSQQEHTLVVPLASSDRSSELCQLMFKDATTGLRFDPRAPEFIRISPAYFWVDFFKVGVVPSLFAIGVAMLLFYSVWWILILVWPLLVALVQFLKWRKAGYMYNETAIVHRKGLLTYTLVTLPFSKIQSVSVEQNIVQQWTQRATLEIRNSTQSIGIPYIDINLACDFRDFLLYSIESAKEEWQ
ncbi:MAG: PH domain-containing protein [Gammaproteobacteria bacterium]|nr:PH domain-containing protein [Gammaproteobacteria bacterium]